MKNPKLIVKPFAKNGQKNVIPENYETSMESNQATWDQGFGQITMLPVAAGGLPPKGQDFNGIFNQISENIVYLSQGGRFKFSAEYAEAIGGYPKGAILQSDDEKKEYLSLIDNNKVDFNTASDISASWKLVNTDDLLAQIASKQPKGDYATKTELNVGLAGKQPTGDYATTKEVSLKLDKTGGQMSGAVNFSTNSSDTYDVISLPVGNQKKNKLRTFRGGQSETQWHEAVDGDSYTLSTGVNGDATALSLSHGAGLRTSGKVIPGDYSNFDNRYSPSLSVPIGASIIWNSSSPIPDNFWPHEGRSFSSSEYPELAKILPGLKIPDDRGYGIRVADNGRGIDTGRTVGTYQDDAIQNIVGEIPAPLKSSFSTSGTGALKKSKYVNAKGGLNESDGAHISFIFDASDSVRTADETRMKNVAKILIMRVK